MEDCNIHKGEILNNLKKGDTTAFRAIFNEYSKKLYPFVFSMTKSRYASEDIIQEVFIKIWVNRETIDSQNSFNSFIYTIARNLTYNYLRNVANSEYLKQEMWKNISVLNSQTENLLQLREYENILSTILKKLPAQKKKIFVLSKKQGKSNQEIAELLEISPKTVKNHLWKTLQLIKTQLQPYISDTVLIGLILFS